MRRQVLADEHGPAVRVVPGLAVDIARMEKLLGKLGTTGRPEALGPCGVMLRLYDRSSVCRGSVIVSQGDWGGTEWIHASIARQSSTPAYADLAALKAAVFGPDRYAFQVFAPADRHVSIHDHALHLWGRADGTSPLPDFGVLGTI